MLKIGSNQAQWVICYIDCMGIDHAWYKNNYEVCITLDN